MVGVVHEEINLSSPSGIIHGHLIVLVKHKQAQMCLQSDNFLKKFKDIYFSEFSTALLTHSLTDTFSQV